jgi:large subunit ribosomal protein L15
MRLGQLKPSRGARRNAKRVGRGPGSGHGRYSCRGLKGQRSRSGSSIPARFEGGQMPLQRRLPKRGFTNIFRVERQIVNIRDLERFDTNSEITVETLLDRGMINNLNRPVKLLGVGELTRALKITVHACSKKAKEIVEKAGGEVNLVT